MDNILNIASLFFTFLGSLCFARGFFISKGRALELGVSRLSGTEEDDLKLPQVKERLEQRKWGVVGAIFIFIGFLFQLFLLI